MSNQSEVGTLNTEVLLSSIAALLPSNWKLTIITKSICIEPQTFIQVESDQKPYIGRLLIGYILLKDADVVVISTHKSSVEVGYITKAIRQVTYLHLIITSCPLYCDTCSNPWLALP